MEISIASNLADVLKRAGNHKRQVPFAMSRALTSTAFAIRSETVERTYPRSFTVRNARFIRAIMRVTPATKVTLTASVFDGAGRDYLERHTKGGTKTPRGANLAIPTDLVTRTAGGAVRASQRPRTLLSRKDAFKVKLGGNTFVAQRVGKARLPIRIMYLLEPSAHIDKVFPFYEDARRVVKETLPEAWSKAWARAISTAR